MAHSNHAAPLALPTTGSGWRIGIVAARWHGNIVESLVQGAKATLLGAGVTAENITLVHCPGSYEIPVCASVMARSGCVDAVIALGVVVRGETAHFEYVSSPVAHGLMQISLETGVPCMFGVLTTENIEQAQERAGGGAGNKGAEAASGALETLETLQSIRSLQP